LQAVFNKQVIKLHTSLFEDCKDRWLAGIANWEFGIGFKGRNRFELAILYTNSQLLIIEITLLHH